MINPKYTKIVKQEVKLLFNIHKRPQDICTLVYKNICTCLHVNVIYELQTKEM